MALSATMKLGGSEAVYTVMELEYSIKQTVGIGGVPEDGPGIPFISVTIKTPGKLRNVYDWMLDRDKRLDGVIKINVTAEKPPKVKTIHFKDAYLTHFHEYFSNQDKGSMTTRLYIHPTLVYFEDSDGNAVGLDNKKEVKIQAPVGIGKESLISNAAPKILF